MAGMVIIKNECPYIKWYLAGAKGPALGDLVEDVPPVSGSANMGYPTQKPLALYERIIRASSNEGDWVLDPFAGCATTPIAAERLGRRWVGIDIWDGSHGLIQERLKATFDKQREAKDIPECILRRQVPVRTDYVEGETTVPNLWLKPQYSKAAWEKLSHEVIREYLYVAQGDVGGVTCAGCGRVLEVEFTQLDHITPRKDNGENHILNRILLCIKCNSVKKANLTLSGLQLANKKSWWMKDESKAKWAQERARNKAEAVRAEIG